MARVKVLLVKDIPELGHAGEVYAVAGGYARNYLFARGLAVPATEAVRKEIADREASQVRKEQAERAAAQRHAEKLQHIALTFPVRVGENDKLYGSITSADIARRLSEEVGEEVDKRKVLLEEPLYPDQMVFFKDVLGKTAVIDRVTGLVYYSVPEKNALTLEETLCAVVFIREILHKNGLNAISMSEAARRFIDGWESEKYRKSLAERNP